MSTETPRPITSTEPDALDIEASQDPDTTTDYYYSYGDDTESTVRTKDVSTTRDPGYVFVNERNRTEWLHKQFGI